MDSELTTLEEAVLRKFVEGDDPVLQLLQAQVDRCGVRSREFTGVGFMTELAPAVVQRAALPRREVRLDGVLGELEGLRHGAGFVLYLKDGLLDALEGYSYDEPWPPSLGSFELRYTDSRQEDLERLVGAGDPR
jgi:hypothetical protein